MGKKEKTQNPDKIGVVKFWSCQFRGISMGCWTIIMTYLMIYCTDTLMLNSAVVGVLLLVSKVFDGITDLFAGYIIDNTNTRLGKARPYELCILALWLCTWLLFSCPAEWSTTVKYIWVFLMYASVNSIFSTFLICNQTAYTIRSFPNMTQIVKLSSYGGIVVSLGCGVVHTLLPTTIANMATSSAGWSHMMAMYALPLAAIGILRFIFVKETVQVDDKAEKMDLKTVITVLKSNKYIYFVLIMSLFYNVILGMSASTYYFTYVVGDLSKYSMLAVLSVPLMLVMFAFPAIIKRMRVSRLIMLGAFLGVIGYVMNFFAGANLALLMFAGIFVGLSSFPVAYVSGLMIFDCAEYNTYCGLHRAESVLSAFSSVGSKVGNGIGSALLGFLLSAGGYIGSAEVQSASATMMIRCLYSVIPAAFFALIFIILSFYKLELILPELRAKNAK